MPAPTSLWTDRPPGSADHDWLADDPAPPAAAPPEAGGGPAAAAAPQPPSRRSRTRRLAIVAGLAALTGGALATGALLDSEQPAPTRAAELPAVSAGRVPETKIGEIYAQVSDGVVSVRVEQGGRTASGTGFVVDADGTIVTNAHVVAGADRARVRFDDDAQPVDAEVVGSDPSSDLAVLRVDPNDVGRRLKVLPLADSDDVRVGDSAIAVGYPLGLDRTATAGIVSGVGRKIEAPNGFAIDEVIQTDAPINPGNSGGPLLDARGRVIGVNSQIATAGSRGSVGIGFAVPSNTVREVVPRLERGEAIARPYLGVSTTTLAPGQGDGAQVADVTAGGPAQRAGLRTGDVIVGIDGSAVAAPDDVAAAIADREPGDRVDIEVRRDGGRATVSVELGRRPAQVP
jgi:putative serine protease PepD